MLMLLYAGRILCSYGYLYPGFRKEFDFHVSLSEQKFTSCHDLHVASTERILHLMKNSIRVDCSATYNAEYVPHKDISLPLSGLPFDLPAAGNDIHNRHLQILYSTSNQEIPCHIIIRMCMFFRRAMIASWAGPGNSDVRHELFHAWNNDTIHIRNNLISTCTGEGHPLPQKKFYKSRLCICPRGPLLDGVVLI
ncbi:hypothetical protein POTOM_042632 [Populus tomentosa]|uniref:Uncharacterized protein n=1 Tax=Populus tomentosa TaxID=118781 RepID=A0A8X7YQ99_POPTO|nr:hypothetical protein POTOM_042632 [Populus tomentosa]